MKAHELVLQAELRIYERRLKTALTATERVLLQDQIDRLRSQLSALDQERRTLK